MKKTKKSSEEPRDRLSELPDSLIFEIFWLLPMRDVVRTTRLSKRWNNLWKTTPYLNFYGHAPKFINRALISWRGFKILKFKFSSGNGVSLLEKSVFGDIDVWVRLAMDNGVEELYLEDMGHYCLPADDFYGVPHSVYSCSSLKVLSLRGCSFQIHGNGNANVQWNQIKSLKIEGPFLDQNLISKVISGSPQLEVFLLNLWDLDENLSIQSSGLKNLSIERPFGGDDYYEPSTVTELRIWSPNLETLDIIGVPYGKCSLMNVSSLTHLTLNFCQEWSGAVTEVDYLGEILGQIFPTIQHVEKLTLTYWWIKGLGAVKEKYLLSPLLNFKFLTISVSDVEYKEIVDLLRIFPKVETLVFGSICDPEFDNNDTSFLQVERNLPESFLLHLRTIEISLTYVEDSIFPFIEILLKHASNLQKMVIRVRGIKPPSMPWSLSQKLLRMPRSSSTAEIHFDEY